MRKFFVIVDAQEDFVRGSLKNDAAQAALPKIKKAAEKALEDGAELIFTLDTHFEDYLQTGEGKHLPVKHCIEGTDGWRIVDELQDLANKAIIIPKHHFGSNLWEEYIQPGDEVTMCGFVSSICVCANFSAIKQIENVEITVLKDCCADINEDMQDAAMKVMAAQQGNIINFQ